MRFIDFFIDPVLRAPTLGSMLMCLSAALVGVIVFVRKRSLLGEALSHASYPGVAIGIILAGIYSLEKSIPWMVLGGAFIFSLAGYWLVSLLQRKLKLASDAALCFVLSSFFGLGITLASYAQAFHTHLFRQVQAYLYGQAATMMDQHILIYALFCLVVIASIFLFFKEILATSFDAQFARTSNIATKGVDLLICLLTAGAVVIGIRSVGVILMSAMLIAPALAARQFTNRLSKMFFLAGGFGLISGFFGNYLSVQVSESFKAPISLPTGPMIVLSAGMITLYALLFAPERGLVIRFWRVARFRAHRIQENLLKTIWRLSLEGRHPVLFKTILEQQGFSKIYVRALLCKLRWHKLLVKEGKSYLMTSKGLKEGIRIVRLHRLWEAYLVNSLGLGVECVHKSAEEMEHVLTPELEAKLTELLDDPKQDPHNQPIPSYKEALS